MFRQARSASYPAICSIVTAIAAAAAVATAQDVAATPPLLVKLQRVYQEHLDTIEQTYEAQTRDWPQNYVRELEALQKEVQSTGDFEGWQAVKGELERFHAAGTVQAGDLVGEPAALRQLQARYADIHRTHQSKRCRDIIDLTRMYLNQLESRKRSATREGHMAEAGAYHAEIEHVEASPIVTRAEFEEAELEAAEILLQTPTDDTGTAGPPPAEPVAAAPEAPPEAPKPQPKGFTSEGVVIHAKGKQPPRIQGLSRVPFTDTPHAPMKKQVSVVASILRDSDINSRSHHGYHVSTTRRSGSTACVVRLAIRSADTRTVLADMDVVVQYYARPAGKGAGRVNPALYAIKHVHLPTSDASYTYVDFPPVSLSKSTYDFRSAWDVHSSSQGSEFYGIIVGIFDADNQLVFQGVSSRQLVDLAKPTKPTNVEQKRIARDAARRKYEAARSAFFADTGNRNLREAYRLAERAYHKAEEAYNRARNQ